MFYTQKVNEILQTESADCGLACLAMIFEFHGVKTNIEYFREKYSSDNSGLSLYDLYKIAQEHGFSAKGLQVDLNEISSLTLPAVAHWGGNHYVILEEINNSKIIIIDPAFGRTTHSIEYASKLLTGVFLEIHRHPDNKTIIDLKAKRIIPSIIRFMIENPTLWPLLTISFLTLTFIQLIELASPYFVSLVVDKSLAERDVDALWLIVFSFSGLFISKIFLSFISNRLISSLEYSYGYGIANFFSVRTLRFPFSFFLKRSPTDLHSRILGADSARSLISGGLLSAPFYIVYILLAIGLMFYMAPIPASVVTLFLLLVVSVEWPLQKWIYSRQKEFARANSIEHSTLATSLLRIEHSKLNGIELHESLRIDNAQLTKYKSLKSVQLASLNSQTIAESIELIQKLVLVLLVGTLVLDGKLTIGLSIAFLMLADETKGRLIALIKLWGSVRTVQVMMERVADLSSNNFDDSLFLNSTQSKFNQPPTVIMKDIEFSFSSLKDPILNNINIAIQPFDKICFVGPSGSGKTTLLRLFAGLISPTSGTIFADHKDIKDLDFNPSYRKIIGGVCSGPRLIDGTIHSNILYGLNEFDPNYYSKVISALSLDTDFQNVPGGLNSLISGDGQGVSTGQAQRIQLANVLLRKPMILILDEPTAHCDTNAALKIVKFLEEYEGTVIVATHDFVFFESQFISKNISDYSI